MGTKNNPANRGKAAVKTFNNKVVKPIMYIGTHVGHGKYIAVQFEDGNVATDDSGKPLMWDAI